MVGSTALSTRQGTAGNPQAAWTVRPLSNHGKMAELLDKAEQSAMGIGDSLTDETAVTLPPQQEGTTAGETSPLGALANAAGIAAGAAAGLAARRRVFCRLIRRHIYIKIAALRSRSSA